MFSKSFIFAAAALPMVFGLTWNTPSNVTSGLVSNISWVSTSTDPVFTVELNHPSFSNSIAIANNVDPSVGTLSIEWPRVTEITGFSLSAVNISNINQIYAQSGTFDIAAAPTTAASGASTASTGSASVASGSTTGSSGVTTGSNTATSDSGSSGTATSASTATSSVSTPFNGAVSFKTGNTANGVVAILATVAGATLFL